MWNRNVLAGKSLFLSQNRFGVEMTDRLSFTRTSRIIIIAVENTCLLCNYSDIYNMLLLWKYYCAYFNKYLTMFMQKYMLLLMSDS
ncbi:hypothetical protein BDF19DRAFT_433454 [Syncephalis fuscata]|nr:hypothetical protein BDF19DRAFT_433454 [Syncephalis fuscata]